MLEGRTFLTQVIELYKSLPCLWKKTDPYYHNKEKRNAAMELMLELFKRHDPCVNKDTVLRKINTLRGSFRKELNKVRQSEKTASSPDEIHIPKLWYYDLMLFLKDQENSHSSSFTSEIPFQLKRAYYLRDEKPTLGEDEIGDDESGTDSQALVMSTETNPGPFDIKFKRDRSPSEDSFKRARSPSEGSFRRGMSPFGGSFKRTRSSSEGSFRITRSKVVQVLDDIASKMDNAHQSRTVQMLPKRQHDSFGVYIAEKLRSLPPAQLPFCQKLINDAIFYAEIGALNLSSRITPQ